MTKRTLKGGRKIDFRLIRYEGQTSGADQKLPPGQKQKVLLDENDELWTELRHQHIAIVTQFVFSKKQIFCYQSRILLQEYYQKN